MWRVLIASLFVCSFANVAQAQGPVPAVAQPRSAHLGQERQQSKSAPKQFEITCFVIQQSRPFAHLMPSDHAELQSMTLSDLIRLDDRLSCLKADIRRQIRQNWKCSSELKSPIVVEFLLSERGTVSNVFMIKRSGSLAADQAALDAVNAAAPFKYPPASARTVRFTFDKRITSGFEDSLEAVEVAHAKISIPIN